MQAASPHRPSRALACGSLTPPYGLTARLSPDGRDETATMDQFIAATLIWLAGQMGVPPYIEPPPIAYLTRDELRERSRHGNELGTRYSIGGMYNSRDDVVYLPTTFELSDPYQQSILVHELVHYLQDRHTIHYPCRASYEEQAYRLQAVWMERHGLRPGPVPHFVLSEIRACNAHAFEGSVLATDRPRNGDRVRRRQTDSTARTGVRVIRGGSAR